MEHQETITFSLPSNMIKEIDKIAEKENITREQILSEALTQYLNMGKIWEQIYKWGEESAKELGIKTEEDIDRIIHE